MRRGISLRLLVLAIALGLVAESAWAQQAQPGPIARGRELFEHEWEPHDKLSPNGDGLGPQFNAKSCVACHFQGAIGGGGPLASNVDVLSIAVPQKLPDGRQEFLEHVATLHPAFSAQQANLVLHKFGTSPEYVLLRYRALGLSPNEQFDAEKQLLMLAAAEKRHRQAEPVVSFKSDGIPLVLSHRNTPALFGAGLLESIPEVELKRIAEEQPQRFPGITGRVAGRFGWRGQMHTLDDFVLGACANELGLQFEQHKQAMDPTNPEARLQNNDLSDRQAKDLVRFIGALPPPARAVPTSTQMMVVINNGERLFDTVGCTACHRPQLGPVENIFSDLLLHDMGPGLADPLPAPPHVQLTGRIRFASSYMGVGSHDIFATVPSNTTQEWRTPPLWGVATSAPYLHDGRAATLDEAIRLHGGEALSSARRYASLDRASQARLLTFLQSLVAPDQFELDRLLR